MRTTLFFDKITKNVLAKALTENYFNFTRTYWTSSYFLGKKSNFRTFKQYNLGNYSFTKNKLYRLGYADFSSIFVDNAITTKKVFSLYRLYRAVVPQIRTKFNISGGVLIHQDHYFTKRLKGSRYRVQFVQKIPKFIKKNF